MLLLFSLASQRGSFYGPTGMEGGQEWIPKTVERKASPGWRQVVLYYHGTITLSTFDNKSTIEVNLGLIS